MDDTRKNKKKGVRRLGSDREFLAAFLKEETPGPPESKAAGGEKKNRHGLPFVEDYETRFTGTDCPVGAGEAAPVQEEEDFARLLDQSLRESPQQKKAVKPVPLKKRLKRYPGPEADLDLHGFTAIGAEARARSFVQNALHQGYFTVRIIVGKGTHSPEGPVLPHVVEDLLKGMKVEKQVLSYEWEGGRKKKSGALIVYLNQFND